jgi:molybdopterin molybdotransferase
MIPGTKFHQASFSAIAASGQQQVQVYRKVSVAIINTGDELLGMDEPLQPWQIRDSNGPTLEFLLKQIPWVRLASRHRVKDSLDAIRGKLAEVLADVDAVLMTGGVSMGDTDYVPQAIRDVGARISFHRIPIRPGKPILGAATSNGKLILGLPGNPVSVAVTSLRLGVPLLRQLAGFQEILPTPLTVSIVNSDGKVIPLTWYRLGQIVENGKVRLVESQGSGDLISLAKSHGFVEVPPNTSGAGPYPWHAWNDL